MEIQRGRSGAGYFLLRVTQPTSPYLSPYPCHTPSVSLHPLLLTHCLLAAIRREALFYLCSQPWSTVLLVFFCLCSQPWSTHAPSLVLPVLPALSYPCSQPCSTHAPSLVLPMLPVFFCLCSQPWSTWVPSLVLPMFTATFCLYSQAWSTWAPSLCALPQHNP